MAAIVEYTCDTCNRTLQITRNLRGLEVINRCTITNDCRGRLYQTDLKEDLIQGEIPNDVDGLENWTQRKLLHNHEQKFSAIEWLITHDLNSKPTINVYDENLVRIFPSEIIYNTLNVVTLVFDIPRIGSAQFINRTSKKEQVVATTTVPTTNVSNNSVLTIAVPYNILSSLIVKFNIVDSGGTSTLNVDFIPQEVISNTFPWSGTSSIFFNNRKYWLYSINIANHFSSFQDGSNLSITEVDFGSGFEILKVKEMLFLLSDNDKNFNYYIDAKRVSSLLLTQNMLITNTSELRKAFPKIV